MSQRKAAKATKDALGSLARALRDFLRGFTGLAAAPPATDAAGHRAREAAAARRPRCC
jgi:hypothetical protein